MSADLGKRSFLSGALAAPLLVGSALGSRAENAPAVSFGETPFAPIKTTQKPAGDVYTPHDFEEFSADLGEVIMNYATAGGDDKPAVLLLPSQTESWWGYEDAMKILSPDYQVFAVDIRGQGRTTRTPGRYTIDNMANDLVRFVEKVIRRPVITTGCSSGGVLSCWLSAYAPTGMVRGSCYEDPPLFASELDPAVGPGIRDTVVGPIFGYSAQYLGDQWEIGDWDGYREAVSSDLRTKLLSPPEEPPQRMKEYDPEWARVFYDGSVMQGCDHLTMLQNVKVPVLFTHHLNFVVPFTDFLVGAISEEQAEKVKELIEGTGQPFTYVSLPFAEHVLHQSDPEKFCEIFKSWAVDLPV